MEPGETYFTPCCQYDKYHAILSSLSKLSAGKKGGKDEIIKSDSYASERGIGEYYSGSRAGEV
jgi:hypothetical protein